MSLALEKNIRFTCSSEDRAAISENLKIIATNIETGDLETNFTKAQVIMLAERHLLKSDRTNIAKVINGFNPSDIQLFIEGNDIGLINLFSDIRDHTLLSEPKLWDSQPSIDKISNIFNKHFFPLVHEGSYLLRLFLNIVNKIPLTLEVAEYLAYYNPTIANQVGTYIIRNEHIKCAANGWIKELKEALKLKDQLINETFFERTQELLKAVENQLKSSERKVILIAGRTHLVVTTQFQKSIENLHNSLFKSSFKFSIVDQTKVIQTNDSDQTETLQKLINLSRHFEGKVCPISHIDTLIKQLERSYPIGQRYEVSQLEGDIFRVALVILSLAQIHNEETLFELPLDYFQHPSL